jgi:phenylpropionate dioxygenase-like ring-hydroxylating dioxygenase large terminal subunit
VSALHARLVDELGYDPDDGVPQLADVRVIDVPVGQIVRAREGATQVAVARLESGKVVIVEDMCPHDGGRISDGFVAGERLVCSRHGWELEPCGRTCTRVR